MQNPLTLVLQDNVDTSIALKYIFLVVLTLNIDLKKLVSLGSKDSELLLENLKKGPVLSGYGSANAVPQIRNRI